MAAYFKIALLLRALRKIEVIFDFVLKKNKLNSSFSINELTGSV